MQSTTSQKPTEIEMWWPSPGAFEDLTVEDAEYGYTLSAPDDSECGEWLKFWSQDEAHHLKFEEEFLQTLTDYANEILEANGQAEAISDEQSSDRGQTEENISGSQP